MGPIEPATKRGRSSDAELVGGLAGQCCCGAVDLVCAVAQFVVVKLEARAGEGVGLQHVGSGGEVGAVNLTNGVGAGDGEDLRTAIVLRAAIVVRREGQVEDLGAHGAVVDEHTAAGFVEIAALYRHGAESSGMGGRVCGRARRSGIRVRRWANASPIVHAFARSCFRASAAVILFRGGPFLTDAQQDPRWQALRRWQPSVIVYPRRRRWALAYPMPVRRGR